MSVQPHPISALLTDEQKARVRAARFEVFDSDQREWSSIIGADIDGAWCCPLGVVLGGGDNHHPSADDVMVALGLDPDDYLTRRMIDGFIGYMDFCDTLTPDEVYRMFGVEPPVPEAAP